MQRQRWRVFGLLAWALGQEPWTYYAIIAEQLTMFMGT